MRANWQFFLLALVMSCTLWFMVSGREEVEAWAKLQIEMKGMPANLIITNGLEPTVDVRVRAPKGLLRGINERQLAYSVDLSGLTPGLNVIPVLPERVPLGSAYEVVELRPSRLNLQVDAMETRQLPAKIIIAGALATDMQITQTVAVPDTVAVRGASSSLAKINSVDVIVPAPDAIEPGTVELAGVVDAPDGMEAAPAQVQVTMTLGLKTVRKQVTVSVDVHEPDKRSVKLKSRKVVLSLELPESRKDDTALLEQVRAELDISDALEPGRHALPYRIHLPEGVWLGAASPSTLTVTIGSR